MKFLRLASPALLITMAIAIGLVDVLARSITCDPNINHDLGSCTISTFGYMVFPHQIIYTLHDFTFTGWKAIAITAMIDVIIVIILWLSPIMIKNSIITSIWAVFIYVLISIVASYVAIYYYVSP